jgi:choline dehydrogenase-like flavoprotein
MFRSGKSVLEQEILGAEVCVVGAGPAGLTVAAELGRAGISTIVVESGGGDYDPAVQGLSRATQSGLPLADVVANRRRQIGGNSSVWVVRMPNHEMGVRYAPLDAIDFEALPHKPHSGWPFSRVELSSHYEAAQAITRSGPYDYRPEAWSEGTAGPWELDAELVESKVFQFGPRARFYDDIAGEVLASRTVTLVHDATAIELLAAQSNGPLTGVRCRTLAGHSFTVEARRFVVATGGLGNPHLLLASRSNRPAGMGNENDLVGRFLQDHPLIEGGTLELFHPNIWNQSTFYDLRGWRGHSGLGYLALSPRVIEQQDLNGLSAVLFPRPNARQTRTMETIWEVSDLVRNRQLRPRHLSRLPSLAVGADYGLRALYRRRRYDQPLYHSFGRGGWSAMPNLSRKFSRWEIVHQAEQSPDPQNRITLNRELDPVGMPIMDIHWRWSESDAKRAAHGRRIIAEELARAGIGKVQLPDDDDLPGLGRVGGTAHHMGTTRMHANPVHGVVDANCRVHSVPNLYVAGSSVFPTSGYANPTLTIVALAHRLARHLIDASR